MHAIANSQTVRCQCIVLHPLQSLRQPLGTAFYCTFLSSLSIRKGQCHYLQAYRTLTTAGLSHISPGSNVSLSIDNRLCCLYTIFIDINFCQGKLRESGGRKAMGLQEILPWPPGCQKIVFSLWSASPRSKVAGQQRSVYHEKWIYRHGVIAKSGNILH